MESWDWKIFHINITASMDTIHENSDQWMRRTLTTVRQIYLSGLKPPSILLALENMEWDFNSVNSLFLLENFLNSEVCLDFDNLVGCSYIKNKEWKLKRNVFPYPLHG